MASLGCFENTDFTKLGFADNLELTEDINRNQLNTLLVCRTETLRQLIGRLSSELCVFFQ